MEQEGSSLEELPALLSRSHISTRTFEHEARFDTRNAEDVHKYALAAAQAEHEKVREAALQAFELHKLREEHYKLQQLAEQEQERLRIETARAVEEKRIRELQNKARQIPKPPPKAPSPPPARTLPRAASPKLPTATNSQPVPTQQPKSQQATQHPPAVNPIFPPSQHIINSPNLSGELLQPQPAKDISNGSTGSRAQPQPQPLSEPQSQINNHVKSENLQPATKPAVQHAHVLPHVERYAEIHKSLKNLRRFIVDAGKQNPSFKKKTGEMRRGIRQSVGQLTGEKGANKQPMKRIVDLLKESLTSIPSPGVDPGNVMVSKPTPIEGATNNGDKLPALFIYLLNIFSKAVVAQFVDEAGVSPKAADPIGVVAVSVFSQVDFYWRNKPLIDILISKIRVTCPVVFGIRGNEGTEEGRARLGWKKDGDGEWVPEQVHNTRMTGLGAGYAALCLRDFSKSRMTNPWPPTHYWQAVASIVSTPPDQTSATQYTVLRALIDGCEQKFMNFYGSAARAALQVALVEFPGRAIERSVAVSALEVLADKLKRDMGLQLRR